MGAVLELVKKHVQEKIKEQQRGPDVFSRSKQAYGGPDSIIVREQLEWIQYLWKTWGPKEFMLRMCWILRKGPEEGEREILPSESDYWHRNLVPFALNEIQSNIEDNLGQKNIFLKPRQGGYTTYMIIRRLYLPCILEPGSGGLLISQNSAYASAHFRILKRVHRLFACRDPFDKRQNKLSDFLHQNLFHTTASNRRELIFDQLDTAIRCASAEVEEVGQGLTLQHVVCTEVARWEGNPEATLANMKEAIPKQGTLDMESTANGFGGYFFEECMRARDTGEGKVYREFKYHFHEWWWHTEYRYDPPAEEDTLTKDEHRLVMSKELELTQIAWRRRKKEELRGEFDEKYPEDDITCFLLSGSQYFDRDILRARHLELTTYVPREKYNKLIIFKKEKPHRNYIIGADVAEGLEVGTNKRDWSAAIVIDEETGEQVAAYREQLIPEEYGWDLADLGRRYNDALIAVERNEDGGSVILTLEVACMYGNLYKHRDWWKKDWKKKTKSGSLGGGSDQFRMREIVGFPTTKKTRPLALNRIRYFLSENPDLLYDAIFIQECLTFIRNQDKRGRPEAAEGCHDDTVMANAIAQYVRHVRLGYLVPEALPHRERYGQIPAEFAADEQLEEPIDKEDI